MTLLTMSDRLTLERWSAARARALRNGDTETAALCEAERRRLEGELIAASVRASNARILARLRA